MRGLMDTIFKTAKELRAKKAKEKAKIKLKAGRPADKKAKRIAKVQLDELLNEADGDPILVMQLMLRYGANLNLDVNTSLRIAEKLGSYVKPKLSSVEQTNMDLSAPTIVFERGDVLEEAKVIEDGEK